VEVSITSKSWSPYLVGALIGVLSWFAFWSADHPLGVTTAFETTAAIAETKIAPGLPGANEYVAEKVREGKPPKIGWEAMLVVGVFVGALISSLASGDRQNVTVPKIWANRFGNSVPLRLFIAFLAGALMMFGARLAQGCTSGHGISGAMQFAISSWIFITVAFGVGSAVVLTVFGRRELDV
jgi:uncharacterized protein